MVMAVMRGRPLPPGMAPDSKEAMEAREAMEPFETIPINAEFLTTMRGVAKEKEDNFSFGSAPSSPFASFPDSARKYAGALLLE